MNFAGVGLPASDEAEITVFGPGYGECIVVHLGDQQWLVVDSCRDAKGAPVARTYLDAIGVAPVDVKHIVVSHWHDDHTRGISDLADYYKDARIAVSNVLTNEHGARFATAYSGEAAPEGRGTKELYKIFSKHRGRIDSVKQLVMLVNSHPKMVQALSPTTECFLDSLQGFMKATPTVGVALKEAPRLQPNNESVAVHIEFGPFAALLGSDLETNHHGWDTLISHPSIAGLRQADLYKVAHHGSITAECDRIWTQLLAKAPASVLTPFHHGRSRLPDGDARQRIRKRSSSAHISSGASSKATLSNEIARRLETLGSKPTPVNLALGAVQCRRSIAQPQPTWQFAYFGAGGVLN